MKVVVLGVGNTLLEDEGIGVRAVEELQRRYVLPPVVQVIDGGTAGMELLESLEDLDKLIIADCVRVGQPPATVHVPTTCMTWGAPSAVALASVEPAGTTTWMVGRYPVSVAERLSKHASTW